MIQPDKGSSQSDESGRQFGDDGYSLNGDTHTDDDNRPGCSHRVSLLQIVVIVYFDSYLKTIYILKEEQKDTAVARRAIPTKYGRDIVCSSTTMTSP